jgi:hypothetical protein
MKMHKEILLQKCLPLSEAELRVSLIQFKRILDIFLCGFSLFNCPEHSLKFLLLLNPMCLLKYVLNFEENFNFFLYYYCDPDYPIS